jgi:protein-disulfide isomerase
MRYSPSYRTALTLILVAGAACEATDAREGSDGVTTDLSASLLETGRAQASRSADGAGPTASPPPGTALDPTSLGFDSGAEGAPIQVVEFSDFGCGYCARFHNEVFPELEREYVATGKVEWKYIPMILGIFGENAELAAHVGECAGEQDRFPAMRDRLFADQAEWKRAGDPRAVFDRFAREQGLDFERFTRCVDEQWRADRVASGTQLSRQAGVRGTPTFFVVDFGAVPGMLPLDVFREVLDTVYAQRTRGR